MKKQLNLIICLFFSLTIKCQSINTNCNDDSTTTHYIEKFLFNSNIETNSIEDIEPTIFLKINEKNRYCKLLIYAKLFDYLLLNGLDLSYDVLKTPPGTLSIGLPKGEYEKNPLIKKIKSNNIKYKLFSDFLFLKEHYEKQVISAYCKEKDKSIEEDVAIFLNTNLSSHPIILQNILLSKYENLSWTKKEDNK